jgi:hypothetical protein
LAAGERENIVKQSTIYGHYEKLVDRESAHEMLKARAPQLEQPAAKTASGSWQSEAGGLFDAMGKSAARAIGSHVGREIIRGVLGSLFGAGATRKRRY